MRGYLRSTSWKVTQACSLSPNPASDWPTRSKASGARAELETLDAMGGAIAAIDYMKARLVESNAERINRIESNETIVVGVNRWQQGEPSPLTAGDGGIMVVDPAVELDQVSRLQQWRADPQRWADSLLKSLLLFNLLALGRMPVMDLPDYLQSLPLLRDASQRLLASSPKQLAENLLQQLPSPIKELLLMLLY